MTLAGVIHPGFYFTKKQTSIENIAKIEVAKQNIKPVEQINTAGISALLKLPQHVQQQLQLDGLHQQNMDYLAFDWRTAESGAQARALSDLVNSTYAAINQAVAMDAIPRAQMAQLQTIVADMDAYANKDAGVNAENVVEWSDSNNYADWSKNYRRIFFDAYPDLEGSVIVHHAIEQQVLTRYEGVFTEKEIHALENLRGIPKDLNNSLHLSDLRKEWNKFYREHQRPTKQDFIDFMRYLDQKYGTMFSPTVK